MRKFVLLASVATAPLLLLYPHMADALPVAFDFTGALQTYVVPTTGQYQITAFGAHGGSSFAGGGAGAEAQGTLTLTAGETLDVIVGGAGTTGTFGAGGGGGSFVFVPATLTPLIVAGGGGGGGTAFGGGDGGSSSAGGERHRPHRGRCGGPRPGGKGG